MACSVAEVLTLVASGARSVNVLGCHVLVVQADDVSVVAADVSLLVLVRALESLQVVQLRRGVGRGRASASGCAMLSRGSVDTWELLWRLAATWTAASRRRRAIHAQLLPHIAHVLRCPEILENVLHILIVVCPSARSATQGRLVVQAAMRSLDAHASDATRRDEVEAELTRFHELHVAETTAVTTAHLLLARHDRCVTVDAVRVGLPVVSWVHAAVRAGHRSKYLVVTLSWTCQSEKDDVSITN